MRDFLEKKIKLIASLCGFLMLAVMAFWLNQPATKRSMLHQASAPQLREQPPFNPNGAPLPDRKKNPARVLPKNEAEHLVKQASENYFFREFDQGAENYRKAIAVYEMRKDFRNAARTYESLGDLYQFANEIDTAEKTYLEAASYHRRNANPTGEARAFKKIGDMFQQTPESAPAKKWYLKALEVVKDEDPNIVLANVQESLGLYYWQQDKNIPEAIVHYKGARDVFSALHNQFGLDHMNNVIDRLEGKAERLHNHAVRRATPGGK